MAGLKAEANGKRLALTAVTLTLFSLAFKDYVLMAAAAALTGLLLFDFAAAALKARWIRRNCRVRPEGLRLRLIAGTVETAEVTVEAPRRMAISVKHPLRFCSSGAGPHYTNSVLALEFAPKLAGTYTSHYVTLGSTSPLNCFSLSVDIPFTVYVDVVPRVVPLAVRALMLIASSGRYAYEVPLQTIGRGTEYAETREYVAGDELRRMDWKATARLQKLMVKQFYEEAGGLVDVVFDAKAGGPVSRDRAAAQFLSLALAAFSQGLPAALTVVDVEGRVKRLEFKDRRVALLKAVDIALKTVEVDYGYLYEFMDPQSVSEVASLLKAMGEGESPSTPGLGGAGDAEVVTCLIGDLTWLLSLYEDLRGRGRNLRVHVPSGAWIDAPDLEQAYVEYERQTRIIRSMMRRGVRVELHGELHNH